MLNIAACGLSCIILPMSTGEASEARDTPNTIIDEAEAVRSGKASQQIMTSVGTVAPCSSPMTPMTPAAAQYGIGSSRNSTYSTAEVSSEPR